MIVFESKNSRIEWLEAKNIVVRTTLAFVKGEELRDTLNAGLQALIKYKSKKWLSDNRLLKPYTPEDAQWIKETWFPNAVKTSSWKYYAIVEPENILGKIQRRKNYDYYKEQGIELQTFETVEKAVAWLDSVK